MFKLKNLLKELTIIVCVFIIFLSNNNLLISPVYAYNEKTYYARVMFDSVYLYKTPSNSSDIYFEIPKTYFVELTGNANEDFYKADYWGQAGYVKKNCVQAISGTPKTPYLNNITFRIYAEKSQHLMEEPNMTNSTTNEIATIPLLTRNITYIGKVSGECLIEGRTDVWFFCSINLDKKYYGYVYSDFCDEMNNITPNTEDVEYINNPSFEHEKTTAPQNSNNNFVGIVVFVLTVPAIVFLFMILKGKSILSPTKNKEIIDY